MSKEKLYIIRTKVLGQTFYLKHLSANGCHAEYSRQLSEACAHTKEEMEYVKKWHLPGLGRWVLLESETKRVGVL